MPEHYSQDRALTEAQVAIATLEVQFANMAAQLAELKQTLSSLNTKLDAVNTTLTEARGGWRTLMAVGGAAAAATAGLAWIGQHVKW
jgi:prefoldin subunit 5